jgi:hypothetical protein
MLATILTAAAVLPVALGQIAENPDDPFLYAVPYPRTRLVHATDPSLAGATAHLRARDPFLLYQLGRDLVQVQFSLAQGAYGQPASLNVPLYVGLADTVHGAPSRFARDHTASCAMCHSSVYREPAGGHTIGSTGGLGRNTTHFYGAGVVEMLGEQVRALILERYDTDRDGLIDRDEATGGPRPVKIAPAPGAAEIDFGDLAPGPDGVPRLNSVFRLWFVDAGGRVLPGVFGFDDPRAAAFGLAMEPFGWGRGRAMVGGREISQGGDAATLREFYTVAADFHMGMQAFDPTQLGPDPSRSGHGGITGRSLSGALQYDFGGSVDRGLERTPAGLSLDDPDGDGVVTELTEGDIDAVEHYLLHAPTPAVHTTRTSEQGREVLVEVGCTRCHAESWRIEPRDPARGLEGDRRLFHLDVITQLDAEGLGRLVGKLVHTARTLDDGAVEPAGGAFLAERVYSDFKHWDIGPEFHERRWDGSLQRSHRTAPLWGVASTAPYGHSGSLLSLEQAIAAHGGAAEAERDAYLALPAERRELLVDYLRSLVLYSTDEIPTDVNGDDFIAVPFEVAGQDVGYERFDARFLFANPPRFEVLARIIRYNGLPAPLARIVNVAETYALGLAYRADSDGDGFADLVRPPSPPPETPDSDASEDPDRGDRHARDSR